MKKLLFIMVIAAFMFACSDDDSPTNDKTTGSILMNTKTAIMQVNSKRAFHAKVESLTNTEVTWKIETTATDAAIEPQSDNFVIFTAPSTATSVKLIAESVEDKNVTGKIDITVLDDMPETERIFYNGNIAAVQSGPQNPTEFTLDRARHITSMNNYHYYNQGALPGTISLKHEDGTVYGPWQTAGRVGQGNVLNAYWDCYPEVTIKAGKYTVIDSDPDTWSHNSGSDYCGFTEIWALKD